MSELSYMEYVYQLKDDTLTFKEGVRILTSNLKNEIVIGAINNNDCNCISDILNDLKVLNIPTFKFILNSTEYLDYRYKAQYKVKYPEYYANNFYEKTLEHFICYKLISLQESDNFIDMQVNIHLLVKYLMNFGVVMFILKI
jgi:hypothetical protein